MGSSACAQLSPEKTMSSFFENTKYHIETAFRTLDLEGGILSLLEKPKNVIAFAIPLPLENGETKIFKAWRVQHTDVLGPYKGGIRYHPASNRDEVEALASLMTWKTSLAGLPYGGAKGAVSVDPKTLSRKDLESLSRSYVRRIFEYIGPEKDIPAPDVGTNAQVMAWMADEYAKLAGYYEPAAFTGKPVEIGGSAGRDVATGFGGAVVLREFSKIKGKEPSGMRVVIQGFGNVGSAIARFLFRDGYKIVGLSDSRGAILNPQGVNVDEILRIQEERGLVNQRHCSLEEASGGKCRIVSNEELLETETDILIPAALENVITEANAERLRTKVILEMANGPVTPEAEAILVKSGVSVIPDILANSGGVVGSYLEWVQGRTRLFWEEEEVLAKIRTQMERASRRVFTGAREQGITFREASYRIAVDRVVRAMQLRGMI